MRKARVYIAGPLNTGMTTLNLHMAFRAATELIEHGYEWFLPHLNLFFETHYPLSYGQAIEHDLHWLSLCDALLRLPGESKGADMEVEYCEEHGIPVCGSIADLLDAVPPGVEE